MDPTNGWERLHLQVRDRFRPFLDEASRAFRDRLVGAAVIGRAAVDGPDFDASRVESIFLFDNQHLRYVEELAPLGRKYGRKGLAAPLVASPKYLEDAKDVFPLEFLNIRLAHVTVLGPDLFGTLEIPKEDLKRQCEREVRTFLVRLRQGYLQTTGDARALETVLREASAGFFLIVRGVLHLLGAPIALDERRDAQSLRDALKLAAEPMSSRVILEDVRAHPKENFERFYAFAQELADHVNDLAAR